MMPQKRSWMFRPVEKGGQGGNAAFKWCWFSNWIWIWIWIQIQRSVDVEISAGWKMERGLEFQSYDEVVVVVGGNLTYDI